MSNILRYRLLVIMFTAFGVLYRLLCIPVGLLVLSATGLLLMHHYGQAVLMLLVALLYYEAVYWFLIARWRRYAE